MVLTDRVALITGGRRIGAVAARELASRGADIGLCYFRSKETMEAVAAAVRERGRRAIVTEANLASPEGCSAVVAATVQALGRLDVLINMASVYAATSLDELTGAHLDAALDVDLKAAYFCSLAAIPHMRAAGGGRIINFTDWVARSGRPRYRGFLPYYVAKAGVIGLTEALALEVAPDNILVNAIAPGPIVPPAGTTEDEVQAVEEATPLRRWGGETEVANVIAMLIDSDFVTGETIRVDGGRHLR
ncbi:MAG: SDR family oxidoreductase [Acidobacteria bacterium]|nr:SDR family oxidoreductase [Acidobacteriota bacterium]